MLRPIASRQSSFILPLHALPTNFFSLFLKSFPQRDLQDGRGVRRGDHFPPHKYIRNTSTCGKTPTEHLLDSSWRPQASQMARTSPKYLSRAKKKGKTETKNRDGTCTSGRELWSRKSFHTLGSPFPGGGGGWRWGKLQNHGGQNSKGVQRAKWRDSHTENQCQLALTSLRGLSAHQQGRVGPGSCGSSLGGQIPGRGLKLAVWTQPEGG